jgi:hypothetical protein
MDALEEPADPDDLSAPPKIATGPGALIETAPGLAE